MGRHRDAPGNRLRAGTWADLTHTALRAEHLTEEQIARILTRIANLATGPARQEASTRDNH